MTHDVLCKSQDPSFASSVCHCKYKAELLRHFYHFQFFKRCLGKRKGSVPRIGFQLKTVRTTIILLSDNYYDLILLLDNYYNFTCNYYDFWITNVYRAIMMFWLIFPIFIQERPPRQMASNKMLFKLNLFCWKRSISIKEPNANNKYTKMKLHMTKVCPNQMQSTTDQQCK